MACFCAISSVFHYNDAEVNQNVYFMLRRIIVSFPDNTRPSYSPDLAAYCGFIPALIEF